MPDRDELVRLIRQFDDRAFQSLLEAPENARGLMQVVAPDIAERLDFTRMVPEPPTFLA